VRRQGRSRAFFANHARRRCGSVECRVSSIELFARGIAVDFIIAARERKERKEKLMRKAGTKEFNKKVPRSSRFRALLIKIFCVLCVLLRLFFRR
jgi:hypothetical protein